jgi:nitrate reductase delta subunit
MERHVMQQTNIYGQLARLFEYPGEDYLVAVRECFEMMQGEDPEVARLLAEFSVGIESTNTYELQEIFTRTFDLNPACTLEIGWHLYGEDYKRGEFLVKMRVRLRDLEVPESSELPDHLTQALRLFGSMQSDEAAQFASELLLPALDKMLAAWKENHNAFRTLLEALFVLLKSRYTYEPARHLARSPDLVVLE